MANRPRVPPSNRARTSILRRDPSDAGAPRSSILRRDSSHTGSTPKSSKKRPSRRGSHIRFSLQYEPPDEEAPAPEDGAVPLKKQRPYWESRSKRGSYCAPGKRLLDYHAPIDYEESIADRKAEEDWLLRLQREGPQPPQVTPPQNRKGKKIKTALKCGPRLPTTKLYLQRTLNEWEAPLLALEKGDHVLPRTLDELLDSKMDDEASKTIRRARELKRLERMDAKPFYANATKRTLDLEVVDDTRREMAWKRGEWARSKAESRREARAAREQAMSIRSQLPWARDESVARAGEAQAMEEAVHARRKAESARRQAEKISAAARTSPPDEFDWDRLAGSRPQRVPEGRRRGRWAESGKPQRARRKEAAAQEAAAQTASAKATSKFREILERELQPKLEQAQARVHRARMANAAHAEFEI